MLHAHNLGYMHMMSMMKYSTNCRPINQNGPMLAYVHMMEQQQHAL